MIPGLLGATTGLVGRVLGTSLDEVKATREHTRDLARMAAETDREERLMELELKASTIEAAHHAAEAEAALRTQQAAAARAIDAATITASANAAMAGYDYDKKVIAGDLPKTILSIIALRKDIFLFIIGLVLAASVVTALIDPSHRAAIISAVVIIVPEIIMAGVLYLFPRIHNTRKPAGGSK
ncbi:MAG: hypothetical protein K0U36_06845 [Alphaproteobacteria bacterium]|nr:hypothetical protein [Alphaproteobacteria bacterium]